MRQIQFRGKSIERKWNFGEWLYGDLCTPIRDGETTVSIWCDLGVIAVDPETIGQFTGLKDMNGTEIYEGDILRFPPKDEWEETSFVGYEVFWHDNDCCERHIGFQMNRHHFYGNICGTFDFRDFAPKTTKRMIVIGNIHDKTDDQYETN